MPYLPDLSPYFNEINQAFEDGKWLVSFGLFATIFIPLVFQWKTLWLPKHRKISLLFTLVSLFTVALLSIGLLNLKTLLLLIVLLLILAYWIYCSYHGKLLSGSLIDCKISNFIRADEPEKAENLLQRYRWCFIDYTGKYKRNIHLASIAEEKGDMRSSIEILSKIDKKTLNEDENLCLELKKANYFSRLGDLKRAERIIEHLKCPDKYLIRVYIIQALIAESEGDLKKSSELLQNAINNCLDFTDIYYLVALNNMGRILRIQRNYTESRIYYQRNLMLVKNSRYRTSVHIAHQNVIDSLILDHKLEEGDESLKEYRSIIDFSNSNDLYKYYTFQVGYYSQKGDQGKLSETFEDFRRIVYPIISRKEQLISDVCQLSARLNSGLLFLTILDQVDAQYFEYSNISIVEKANCYMGIHWVLQSLSEKVLLGSYIDLYNRNRENIRIVISELENYLFTIPEYCLLEKVKVMRDIVRAKTCNVDYDRDEVLRMLNDIKKTYSEHGNFIGAFNIGLDICDEACMQKKYEEMWKSTRSAIEEYQQISGHPDTIPALVRIAFYAYKAGYFDISKDYVELYEETGISIFQYPWFIQNYYHLLKP